MLVLNQQSTLSVQHLWLKNPEAAETEIAGKSASLDAMIVAILDQMADTMQLIRCRHALSSRLSTHPLVLVLLVVEVVVSLSNSPPHHRVKTLLVADWVARWVRHNRSHLTVVSMAQPRIHHPDLGLQMDLLVEVGATSLHLVDKKLLAHLLLHAQMSHQLHLAGHRPCVTLLVAASLILQLSAILPPHSPQPRQLRMGLL